MHLEKCRRVKRIYLSVSLRREVKYSGWLGAIRQQEQTKSGMTWKKLLSCNQYTMADDNGDDRLLIIQVCLSRIVIFTEF